MCAKKKAIPTKMWKLAGESLRSQPLSATEQEQFAEEFSIYRGFRGGSKNGLELGNACRRKASPERRPGCRGVPVRQVCRPVQA